jgi:hypothetical protein
VANSTARARRSDKPVPVWVDVRQTCGRMAVKYGQEAGGPHHT